MRMDEREMTSGVIPLRHSSLPGHVKLPQRYEKAAMGTNGIPARVRKISIQPGQGLLGDCLSDRLDDLMAAFMWVKQELIMLRQHDVLLKRQFFHIQDSIQSLQKPEPTSTPDSSTSPAVSSSTSTGASNPPSLTNGQDIDDNVQVNGRAENHADESNGHFSLVRQACSVSMLHVDSEEEEEEDADTFADEFFRPRTSSMRTCRDMAALARRRGSKDLI